MRSDKALMSTYAAASSGNLNVVAGLRAVRKQALEDAANEIERAAHQQADKGGDHNKCAAFDMLGCKHVVLQMMKHE